MNRYPWWTYTILGIALLVGPLYTVPNLYGEAPAVQVSSGKATLKLDATLVPRIEQVLAQAQIKPDFVQFDGNSVRARLADHDTQLGAEDIIGRTATFEMRMINDTAEAREAITSGVVPFGSERFVDRDGSPLILTALAALSARGGVLPARPQPVGEYRRPSRRDGLHPPLRLDFQCAPAFSLRGHRRRVRLRRGQDRLPCRYRSRCHHHHPGTGASAPAAVTRVRAPEPAAGR
jgi:hypothetical protein